jgi:hypothetical protein
MRPVASSSLAPSNSNRQCRHSSAFHTHAQAAQGQYTHLSPNIHRLTTAMCRNNILALMVARRHPYGLGPPRQARRACAASVCSFTIRAPLTNTCNATPMPCPLPRPRCCHGLLLEYAPVWHALKVDGGCRHALLGCHEAVCEVTTMGQVQAHDSVMRLQQGCAHTTEAAHNKHDHGSIQQHRLGEKDLLLFQTWIFYLCLVKRGSTASRLH